ncbi:unnamed protein product [Bursaphelenchus xylophilus]|uniref:Amino acid transporter n=1 Tax=Bursaphelenchus xylophilus TaxID=6326 RepID=A0A7I8WL79_BURXY|nr:unnamed protein product [Bursaphelenchus xylophilus]CAG9106024.1 unnamed protein product [Bursaphelenchus xylophilus]
MGKKKVFKDNLLLVFTIGAVFVGVIVGFIIRKFDPHPNTIVLLGFPGEILMNMLKLTILPLIVCSLISGMAQLDAKQSRRMCFLSLAYYLATTLMAVVLGIILVLLIHPGDPKIRKDVNTSSPTRREVNTLDTFLDIIRNMFPDNMIKAAFEQTQTKYVKVRPKFPPQNDSLSMRKWRNGDFDYNKPTLESTSGMNCLGVIVMSMGFGIVLSILRDEARPVINFFKGMDKVIMTLVNYLMLYSPIGIMSLVVAKILAIADLAETGKMLALYMVTVLIGLAIHGLITLPVLYTLLTKKNPFVYMRGLVQAWVTALGTGSSSATLPMTFKCLEENNGVDKRVTRFVLPVGATINMDGTALYEAVAAIFIAQVNGIELSLGQVITVCLTATLASIGAASVPSAGLVTMLLVLGAVGLPLEDVSLIVAVDWLLDRIRTSINVVGDAFGAGIVHHYVKDRLERTDSKKKKAGPSKPSALLTYEQTEKEKYSNGDAAPTMI